MNAKDKVLSVGHRIRKQGINNNIGGTKMKKKVLASVLALIMLFAMFGCVDDTDNVTVKTDDTEDGQEQVEEPKEETEEVEEETEEPTEEPTEKETEPKADIGTRKNPAKLGDTLIVETDNLFDPIKYEVSISNLQTDQDENRSKIEDWNMFNDIPDDVDVIMIDATLKILEFEPDDDRTFRAYPMQFEYLKSDYTAIENKGLYAHEDDEFRAELYEGGTAEGTIVLEVPKDENLKGFIRFDDVAWFELP